MIKGTPYNYQNGYQRQKNKSFFSKNKTPLTCLFTPNYLLIKDTLKEVRGKRGQKVFRIICKVLDKVTIGAIKTYQKFLSPLTKPCCRFYPTCSNYALIAVKRYGVLRATPSIVKRIVKCNPYCKGGYDPVI